MHAGSKKNAAIKLRMTGKSYAEIQKVLTIPKSTLALWLKDVAISQKARQRLNHRIKSGHAVLLKRNKMQTHLARTRARANRARGAVRISKLSDHDLLVIGTCLYWGEGHKKLRMRDGIDRMGHAISFVNADPDMVRMFIRFLRVVFDVPISAIKAQMRLYEHISEPAAKQYWMRACGIPDSNFQKTTWLVSIASKRRKPFNRLPYGTLQIEVYDTEKFHILMGMIEGVKKGF